MSPDPRLLPAPIRTAAALLAAGCGVVFLVLAVIYHGSRTAGRLDNRLFAALPRASGRGHVWQVAVAAPWVAMGVVVVVTTALLLVGRWREALFAAAAPGLTLAVAEVGKRVIDRTTDGFLALPSGHTAGITSVSLTLAVLLLRRFRQHVVLAAALGWLGATLLGAAMALVMVFLHDHYPTDTLAGYCAAVATTLGVAFAVDALPRRGGSSAPPQAAFRSR